MSTIAIFGGGRMAQAIVQAARRLNLDLAVTTVVSRHRPEWLDELTMAPAWCDSLETLTAIPDVLIDFTLPQGTLVAAQWCEAQRVPLLSGVTGLGDRELDALESAGKVVPVLWSANLGLGINVLADLARRAASMLGSDVPVTILDIHHQWKKDAPSGTALMLGGKIDAGRGQAEGGLSIQYENIREGEVIGEHQITFQLDDEVITLTHAAQNRTVFAKGALTAAGWLLNRSAGLYSAGDWMGDTQTE